MFNTIRPSSVPDCLSHKKYNTKEVVEILNPMFHGKCYLCERDELSDPEIEHFDPHEDDNQKKYDWNNLYYSCSRCNNIKSHTNKNLLDCCDSTIDVFRMIKCILPSIPDEPISVIAIQDVTNPKTINTVKLLDRCYNEDNTALRGITRVVLIEKIFYHYTKFLEYRYTLKNKESTSSAKQHAKESIEAMLKVSFPFSVFWRWHLLSDSFLSNELADLITF
jgi:uncharacterized protein (TIGR02646 family)